MADILALVLTLLGTPSETCNATVFGGAADRHRGGPSRCLTPPRRIRADDHGIAHRTLPCGSWVLVTSRRTGRSVLTRVIDHGPYGAVDATGEWVLKRRRSDPGKWKGCADLTYPVGEMLGIGGRGQVTIRRLK